MSESGLQFDTSRVEGICLKSVRGPAVSQLSDRFGFITCERTV